MHPQGFGSQGCEDISEVILNVNCNAVEKEPVLQGVSENGQRVIGIFQVPVVGGHADECISNHECTRHSISYGFGRLGDKLLWHWSCGHVSDSQIRKTGGGHKNGNISGTISQIAFKLAQHFPVGVC